MSRDNHWLGYHWSGRLACNPAYFILFCLRLFVLRREAEKGPSPFLERHVEIYREAIGIGVNFLGHACTIPLNLRLIDLQCPGQYVFLTMYLFRS